MDNQPQELNLSQFDRMALIHNAGYNAFRSMYETRLPPPKMPIVQTESRFVPIALCIMIIASVFVSGSRTVLEFGGGLIGISAFVMLEGAIVTYAFFRTRLNFNDERMESVKTLANRGLGLSFAVAVAANVHSVIKGVGIETPPAVTIVILILVAISAPTLAFISGDIMALELIRNNYKQRKAETEYTSALEIWSNDLNAAWNREKNRGAYRIEQEAPRQISQVSQPFHENFMKTNEGKKPRVKLHEVAAKIREAGDENLSTEQMMDKYEISMGSTTKIRELLNTHE